MPPLHELADQVDSPHQLAAFLTEAADSFVEDPGDWENDTLESFLRAWAAWMHDISGYFLNLGQQTPETPSWSLVAGMVLAAKVSE